MPELRRYARHLNVKGIGEEGQQKLLISSVLVIGAGGLGASAISYLAAAGIGRIGIVDHDMVELSNLNRQIIHETGDIGRSKAESAADRVEELNPDVTVPVHRTQLSEENADELVAGYDIIIDALDNYAARFALNDACLKQNKPWIHAAVRGWEAVMTTFLPAPTNPCYRCLIPDLPPAINDCAVHGIAGPVVGIIGSLQALETIKYLTRAGETLNGKLLRFDGFKNEWKTSALEKDPGCPVCNSPLPPGESWVRGKSQ